MCNLKNFVTLQVDFLKNLREINAHTSLYNLGNSSETENDDEELEKPLPFYWVGTGQSRLQSEFSLLCKLGKGGYGDVYKVKNNLDEKTYAIKRIQLDPKNKPLTKKLKREVELLSRLNHENVVRYYYSWIEVTTIDHHDEEDNSDEESSSNTHDKNLSRTFLDSDEVKTVFEKNPNSSKWLPYPGIHLFFQMILFSILGRGW